MSAFEPKFICLRRICILALLLCRVFSLTALAQTHAAPDVTTVSLHSAAQKFEPGVPFLVSATFNRPVQGFTTNGLLVAGVGGVITDFSGAGASYQFRVTATKEGTVVTRILEGAAFDDQGRPNKATGGRISSATGTDPSLRLHLTFDEPIGRLACDESIYGNHGTLARFHRLQGGYSFEDHSARGVLGNALFFDDTLGGYVFIPPLGIQATTVTFSAWIRQQDERVAGIITLALSGDALNPDQGKPMGLIISSNGELNYTWEKDRPSRAWKSGLIVPDDKWVHVALVVEPNQATLYLTEDGITTKAVNPMPHPALALDRQILIGLDPRPFYAKDPQKPNPPARLFRGMIDDVRVYNRALSAEDIHALASDPNAVLDATPAENLIANAGAITKRAAVVNWPYLQHLGGDLRDSAPTGQANLTFSKVSGPAWLMVAPSGELTGTPLAPDAGANEFVIRAANSRGIARQATVQINVNLGSDRVAVQSRVNPVWVEGAVNPETVKLTGILNGSDTVRVVRESSTRWYAENTSGTASPAGVLLQSETGNLRIIARFADGTTQSVVYNLHLAPTDLTGRDGTRDSVQIRRGDALLLTASGDGGSLQIANGIQPEQAIDVGAPSQTLQSMYPNAGSYTASASIDGQAKGSLRVDVVSADLRNSGLGLPCDDGKPIAVLVGHNRQLPIRFAPPHAQRDVVFTCSEPGLLNANFLDRQTTSPGLSFLAVDASALSTTVTLQLQVRLDGPDCPIIDSRKVISFESHSTAETTTVVDRYYDDGSILCKYIVTVKPRVPGLDINAHMWGEGGTFDDSTTDLNFSSAALDENDQFVYRLIWRPGASLCHVWRIYQDGISTGQ